MSLEDRLVCAQFDRPDRQWRICPDCNDVICTDKCECNYPGPEDWVGSAEHFEEDPSAAASLLPKLVRHEKGQCYLFDKWDELWDHMVYEHDAAVCNLIVKAVRRAGK